MLAVMITRVVVARRFRIFFYPRPALSRWLVVSVLRGWVPCTFDVGTLAKFVMGFLPQQRTRSARFFTLPHVSQKLLLYRPSLVSLIKKVGMRFISVLSFEYETV